MTAPALPGAAPDPARLPPEVESHVVAVDALLDAVRKFVKKDTPTGLMRLNDAMVAARDSTAALRTAIARALGGDGEPVAWGIENAHGEIISTDAQQSDNALTMERFVSYGAEPPYRVVPLYTRPAATGAEVERVVRDAVLRVLHVERNEGLSKTTKEIVDDAVAAAIRARGAKS